MAEDRKFSYEAPLEKGMAEIVVRSLLADDARDRLRLLFDAAAQFVEGMITDMTEKEPPPKPVACSKGCAFCCTGQEVHVTAPEVFRILDEVSENFRDPDKQALLSRTMDVTNAKDRAAATDGPPQRFACPLLVDDSCSVYGVRPFLCRGFNSYDPLPCELRRIRGVETAVIEGYVHPMRISRAALNGLRAGSEASGLEADVLDLAPALRVAFSTPNARERWLEGETVFAAARARLKPDDAT